MLSKNENFVHHIAVGGDTNHGAMPWPVSPPATLDHTKKDFFSSYISRNYLITVKLYYFNYLGKNTFSKRGF